MESWRKVERFFKPLLPYLLSAMVGAGISFAGPIKNWTTGEYVTYTDLNATLNHLHSNLGHGHGPIITSADISPSANIRPEQTTFGASINKSMVANGVWKINPDGGTAYLPVNYSGTLDLTVYKISTTGFSVTGAPSSGLNSDGGTEVYSVFYRAVGFDIADSLLCVDQGSVVSLTSPVNLAVDCYDMTDATWPLSMKNPSGIAIQVFNNKVN